MARKLREQTILKSFRLTKEVDAMLTQLAEDNFTSKTGIIQQLVSKQFKSTYGDVEPRVFIDEPKEDTKPQ